LIQQVGDAGGEPRFTMLETIREYALEQLQVSGEEPALRRQHTAYYLRMAEAAEPELRGPQQRMWLDRLEAEHDNLRAALAWSQAPVDGQASGLRLVAALRWFWFYRGYLSEGRRWLATMLDIGERPARARTIPHARERARALGSAATLAWQQGDYQMARAQRAEAVSIWRELGDTSGLADELHYLGHLTLDQCDTITAHSAFEESLVLYRELGNGFLIHALVGDLGMVAYHQGDYVTASRLLEKSVTGLRTHGPTDTLGDHLNRLGDLARLANDYERAAQLYDESLALFREIRGTLGIASALHKLGYVAQYRGEYMRAQALFAESLALQWQMGNKQGIAECLVGLAGLAGVRDARVGGGKRVVRLLAAAAGVLEAMNVPLAPADRADFDRAHAAARRESDEAAWTEAWSQGQAMTLEQAITDALGDTAQP
jgi:tetratricopeptide (TPR) repeat protein